MINARPVQHPSGQFEIHERVEPDGRLRLVLVGHLHDAGSRRLAARLGRLRRSRRSVWVDLSELELIDRCGADVILAATAAAREAGCRVEVTFLARREQ